MIFATLLVASVLVFGQTFAFPNARSNYPLRIVGGTATTIQAYPYQIALLYNGQFICGGTIIEASTILTAAHCIPSTTASAWSIRAGSTSRSRSDSLTQTRRASRVVVHTQYSRSTNANDIAIIKLSQPLTLNAAVAAATLPAAGTEPVVGSQAVATGWGTTSEGGRTSDTLMTVTLPVVSAATCRSAYGSSRIISSMMCAGVAGKDTCQGDSGGPLAASGTRNLIGVTSFGAGCGRSGYPGVYTKVSAFRSWISTNGGV